MYKKETAAVVVTYNRKEKLINCIESLLRQTPEKPEILIIDNASTDGTHEEIQKYINSGVIKYFNTGENLGGAGGFAYGIKKAYKMGFKYIWLMDDDCIMEEDALEKFMEADKKLDGKYGFLSGRVNFTDGEICRMDMQKIDYNKAVKNFDKNLQKLWCATFVSCFLKASTVATVGLPISEFFIWTDDIEYTRRISKLYPCYYVSDSVTVHDTASNSGSDISVDTMERIDRYKLAYRNEVFVYRREGAKEKMYWWARLHLHALRILKNAPDHKCERLKTMVKGTMEGFSFRPKIKRAGSRG